MALKFLNGIHVSGTAAFAGNVEVQNSQLKVRDTSSNLQLTMQASVGGTSRIMAHNTNLGSNHDLDIVSTQIDFLTGSISGSDNSRALFLDSSRNATFAGDVTVGALTSGETAQLVINHEGGSGAVAKFMSRTNRAFIQVGDNDTNGYLVAEGNEFAIGRAATVSGNSIIIDASHNATFAGDINLNQSHINIDGNGAVIFDNTNNNNAWYIRNGGSNSATLQFGLGTPGANIKHTFAGDGSATFAGTITTGHNNIYTSGDVAYLIAGTGGDSNNQHLYLGSYHGTTLKKLTWSGSNNGFYPQTDNAFTLGLSSKKWSTVYATTFNGALTGTASNADLLDNINSNLFANFCNLTFVDSSENTVRSTTYPTPARSNNPDPEDYSRVFHTEMKQKSSIGSPVGGYWTGLISMAPYNSASSGWYTTQINFGADGTDGDLYTRRGTGTSWGSWRQIITADSATFTGDVSLAATNKLYLDGGSNTYIKEEAADEVGVYAGGTRRLRINDNGIESSMNVYSGITGSFRNYAGDWKATTGTTGKGFEFANTVDNSGNALFTIGSDGDLTTLNGWAIEQLSGNYVKFGNWVNLSGTGFYTSEDMYMDLDDTTSRFVVRGVSNAELFKIDTALNGGSTTFLKNTYWGDNVKLLFGDTTNPDLEIYHDGSHSRIDENGTGGLILRTGDFYLRNPSNADMIYAASGGGVKLYHNNVCKLETYSTGAGVTGNFYLFTGNYIHFDNGVSNNYAIRKNGTTLEFKTGGTYNFLNGVATFSGANTYNKIQTYYAGDYTSGFKFSDYNGGIWYDAGNDDLTLNSGHANSQMIFNSGGALALTLDASQNATFAGNVGIGVAPSTKLHVYQNDTNANEVMFENDGTGDAGLTLRSDDNVDGSTFAFINFDANSSTNGNTRYARIRAYIEDNTQDTQDGKLLFTTIKNASDFDQLTLDSSGATFAGDVTVTGDFQVTGITTTTNVVNLDVSDNIIGLNRGSTSNTNDSGIIIERGSTGDNAAFLWDESADRFAFGTTTANPAATGNITFTRAPIDAKGFWTSSSATAHWGPYDGGGTYGTLTWDTGYAMVHANGSNVLKLGSGADTDAVVITGSNVAIAGSVTTSGGTSSIHNRIKITNNADPEHQLNIGQWDGANHRIEGDANRPIVITSYQGNVNLGTSGSTKLNVSTSGITVTGTIVKSGGTSSQYLMADGSVSTTTWNGGTITNNLTISNASPALNLTDTDNSSNIAFSSVGGALIVNSTSDQVYQIGGIEKMRLTTSGLGLGATSPNRLLHIDNTSNATKASAYFYTNAQHTGADTQAHVSIYSDHASSTGDVLYVRGDGTGNLLTLNKGGSDKLVVADDGIGTFASSINAGNTSKIEKPQNSTQFDRDCFLRLHPSATTNSGGYTNMVFGTSTTNNYGVTVGARRAGTGDTSSTNNPEFSVRILNDAITGTEVLNINTAGNATFAGNISHQGLTPTAGTDIDQIYTVTKSLTVTTAWQDTGVNATDLATGTYIIQMYTDDHGTNSIGHYSEYYSGIMSWYSGNTNSTETDELVLHRAGHAPNHGDVFLRIERTASADTNDMCLQIKTSNGASGAANYVFRFRRMI